MENKVQEMRSGVPAREIGVITAEVRELCRQAQTMALMYAIEIGRRLVEAKEVLPHGEWGNWLKNEVEFSQSTANNFMRLFDEYGAAQITIFGATTNSQSIANLPYTKALQLLAVPSEEREAFAESVDAENLSVSELKAAIKERNDAIAAAEQERKRRADAEDAAERAEAAAKEAEKRANEAVSLEAKVKDLEARLAEEKKKPAKLSSGAAKELREKTEREAEARIKKELANMIMNTQKEAEAAKKAAEEAELRRVLAENEAKEAREKLNESTKLLKTANPAITTFKTYFDTVQEILRKMKTSLCEIRERDTETAAKLDSALCALAENIKAEFGGKHG